ITFKLQQPRQAWQTGPRANFITQRLVTTYSRTCSHSSSRAFLTSKTAQESFNKQLLPSACCLYNVFILNLWHYIPERRGDTESPSLFLIVDYGNNGADNKNNGAGQSARQ